MLSMCEVLVCLYQENTESSLLIRLTGGLGPLKYKVITRCSLPRDWFHWAKFQQWRGHYAPNTMFTDDCNKEP